MEWWRRTSVWHATLQTLSLKIQIIDYTTVSMCVCMCVCVKLNLSVWKKKSDYNTPVCLCQSKALEAPVQTSVDPVGWGWESSHCSLLSFNITCLHVAAFLPLPVRAEMPTLNSIISPWLQRQNNTYYIISYSSTDIKCKPGIQTYYRDLSLCEGPLALCHCCHALNNPLAADYTEGDERPQWASCAMTETPSLFWARCRFL